MAELVSVPLERGEDLVITKGAIEKALNGKTEAIVIRTVPNEVSKKVKEIFAFQPALFGGCGFILRMRYSAFINRFAKCR
jgi:hypothetical protein